MNELIKCIEQVIEMEFANGNNAIAKQMSIELDKYQLKQIDAKELGNNIWSIYDDALLK